MSLTSHLKDGKSPLRRFFEEHLGNVSGIQRRYREGAGQIAVPGGAANAGTIGTATDWLLRFIVHQTPDTHLALAGAAHVSEEMLAAAVDLAGALGTTVGPFKAAWLPVPGRPGIMAAGGRAPADGFFVPSGDTGYKATFTGPVGGSTVPQDILARGCWALALLTEVFRAGPAVLQHGPLAEYAPITVQGVRLGPPVTADHLLALAPLAALEELVGLRAVIERTLLPALGARRGQWTLGPTFVGSRFVGGADADLIAADLLVELKTTLGRKRDDGTRACVLDKLEVFQVVGYALLDFKDYYRLKEVLIFNARFSYAVSWSLDDIVQEMSKGTLDARGARAKFEPVVRALS